MEGIDLAAGVGQLVIIGNYIIGNIKTILPACLRGQYSARLFFIFGVACKQAPELRVLVTVDDENTIHELPDGRFNQQWYDDDLILAACSFRLNDNLGTNPGMQYRFEFLASGFVRKDDLAHRWSIEAAIRVEDLVTERGANFVQCRLAWLYELAGNNIRVDDRYAIFGKQFCDSALATGDATGQRYS